VRKQHPALGIDLKLGATTRAYDLKNAVVHTPILLDKKA
jgi:hypothetical protein